MKEHLKSLLMLKISKLTVHSLPLPCFHWCIAALYISSRNERCIAHMVVRNTNKKGTHSKILLHIATVCQKDDTVSSFVYMQSDSRRNRVYKVYILERFCSPGQADYKLANIVRMQKVTPTVVRKPTSSEISQMAWTRA